MQISFTKMHGTGNDFCVIDATRERFAPSAELLQHLTHRRFGVGCDQVLVVEAASQPDVDFDYRIFNADGTEVGQCGNGSRCLAQFVAEHGLSSKKTLRVRTSTSVLELQRLDDGQVRVNMGPPRLNPADIPFLQSTQNLRYTRKVNGVEVEFGALSMGNPHLVMQVDDVDSAPVESLGPLLESHPDFPQRVNVGFLQIKARHSARLRVFERGAGETLACGSGACAAMVMARRWNLLDAQAGFELRGGTLQLEWQGDEAPVMMTGPAQTVFTGQFEWNEHT